jgi:glycine cleavage system H protein
MSIPTERTATVVRSFYLLKGHLMANWTTPAELKYRKSDEWLRIEGDTGTIGVSDYAQDQLNDIVFVELPQVGAKLNKDDSFGVVESVKAASDVYMPVSGEVIEVNKALEKEPELINGDPYGKGWIIKIRISDASGAAELMDAAAYAEYCKTR